MISGRRRSTGGEPSPSISKMTAGPLGRSTNGLAMLIYQGAAAFEMWTRHTAPVDVMRAALEADS